MNPALAGLGAPGAAKLGALPLVHGLGTGFVTRLLCRVLGCLLAVALALGVGQQTAHAQTQGVQLSSWNISRTEGGLSLDFAARINLSNAAEEALARGVPMYFVAEATVLRSRWYWRDERVARVARTWRVAFQPLTNTWRVSLAGLNQTFNTLPEALVFASRAAGWRLAEAAQLDAGRAYHVQFNYRLDTNQLPGPMQFGLGGGEWALGVSSDLKVEP